MGKLNYSVLLCFFLYAVNFETTMAAKLDAVAFSKSVQDFANDLYANVVENEKKNVVMSPLSIEVAVALAGMGAGGSTADEIQKGLKLGSSSLRDSQGNFASLMEAFENEPTVKIANKIYVQTGHSVNQQFQDIATKSFKSESQVLNFAENVQSANTINGWVEGKTNNKIKDLIKSGDLDALTRMVLVNAIYFKGLWQNKFKPEATTRQPFWVTKTESKQVDMMKTKADFLYGEFEDLNAKAIELPYANSSISMFIILPNEKDGLAALQSNIRSIDIAAMRQKMHKQEVNLLLPKFKIEYEIELKDVLTKMGMGKMFSQEADFSGLLETKEQLSVSKVIHKAFIEVNEEGTEAAAATAGLIRARRAIPMHQDFIADHPFIASIVSRGEKDVSLFAGTIKDIGSVIHSEL